MAKILLAWELGSGLGHLVRLLPLARGLAARGHAVTAVLPDVAAGREFFAREDIVYVEAPRQVGRPKNGIASTITFAQSAPQRMLFQLR